MALPVKFNLNKLIIMKPKKSILILFLIFYAFTGVKCQVIQFSLYGSYDLGLGYVITDNLESNNPLIIENQKLKLGVVSQIELAAFYKSFGFGIIHNSYSSDATTNYDYADVNNDGEFEGGILIYKLRLHYSGLEFLYKTPPLLKKINFTFKCGIGYQLYLINKDIDILGNYSGHINYDEIGNAIKPLVGTEVNYQLFKRISLGLEATFIPGNYNEKLKSTESSYITSDNVPRLNTALKIKVDLVNTK